MTLCIEEKRGVTVRVEKSSSVSDTEGKVAERLRGFDVT